MTSISIGRHPSKPVKERDTQALIIAWLRAEGFWVERRNTGAMLGNYRGKSRLTRFSSPGTADIMATRIFGDALQLYWVEVKAENGKQTELQQAFQFNVQQHGHKYMLVRSLEDVQAAFGRGVNYAAYR